MVLKVWRCGRGGHHSGLQWDDLVSSECSECRKQPKCIPCTAAAAKQSSCKCQSAKSSVQGCQCCASAFNAQHAHLSQQHPQCVQGEFYRNHSLSTQAVTFVICWCCCRLVAHVDLYPCSLMLCHFAQVSSDAGIEAKDMLHADFVSIFLQDEANRRLQDAL